MSTISCDICRRRAQDNHSLNCTTCARSSLYGYRIELAKCLLAKEAVARQVEAIATGDLSAVQTTTTLDGAIVDMRECVSSGKTESALYETRKINANINRISTKAVELRKSIEELKKVVLERKARIRTMKSDNDSAHYDLNARSLKTSEHIKKATKDIEQKRDERFDDIRVARIVLSRKMAELAGLKKTKKYDSKLKAMREVYEIAKVPIFELRQLNSADPEILTASLTQVAYLISRVATYLSIRLPAAMLLPSKQHPTGASIFLPSSSYVPRQRKSSLDIPSKSAMSQSVELSSTEGMRSLVITKSVPQLYREHPEAFVSFIDAVTLLGWNIAWLCKSQGMGGLSHWTDITNIGRNLYQLLSADIRIALRTTSERIKQKSSFTNSEDGSAGTPAHLGRFSHGSAKHFLFSPEGMDLMRGWRLATCTQVIDKLKMFLVNEMQGAEWEVLDEGEWNDHEDMDPQERPVVVRSKSGKPGTAGWTRVRSRPSEDRQ